jgi:DNA-binding CsgD family transcriptional regulator
MLEAMAGYARGAVELAAGDAKAALSMLRTAAELWQRLGVPYEVARTRELVGRCCRALSDDEAADLEFDAARLGYERLGAVADATRLGSDRRPDHGLTPRELEVLRRVAAGRSNREIASELVISEHTVARHVQNIFAKLDVSSRTAAASFAFEHELV